MKETHVEIIRCRADNYAYLIHDEAAGDTALIDAPEAAPIQAALNRLGWTLTDILLTHHHDDHIEGVEALRSGTRVIGAAADAHRLPALDLTVAPGDSFTAAGEVTEVLDAPGHTIGHIAFHMPGRLALFSGDSLMVHGCGRLFEGTPAQMQTTFDAMNRLPDQTRILSGHDYADANLRFAANYAPDAAALAARKSELSALAANREPTVGVTLASERLLNPYLRVHLDAVKAAARAPGADPSEVFSRIRAQKDSF
jgi:hydroxyacylglutathione hydrolase